MDVHGWRFAEIPYRRQRLSLTFLGSQAGGKCVQRLPNGRFFTLVWEPLGSHLIFLGSRGSGRQEKRTILTVVNLSLSFQACFERSVGKLLFYIF